MEPALGYGDVDHSARFEIPREKLPPEVDIIFCIMLPASAEPGHLLMRLWEGRIALGRAQRL